MTKSKTHINEAIAQIIGEGPLSQELRVGGRRIEYNPCGGLNITNGTYCGSPIEIISMYSCYDCDANAALRAINWCAGWEMCQASDGEHADYAAYFITSDYVEAGTLTRIESDGWCIKTLCKAICTHVIEEAKIRLSKLMDYDNIDWGRS